MPMGKERKYMPFLILFIIGIFIFGFVKVLNGFKSTAKVLSYKDSVCKDMFISEAILLAQNSNCMSAGTLNVYEYVCNEDIGRISFPMELKEEKENVVEAHCHIFVDSSSAYLQLKYEKEVE